MSSGSATETVTQNSEPWSQAQPYLTDLFRNAQNQYRQGAEYYPGSTVVPFSPNTQQGMSGLQQQFSQNPVGYDQALGAVSNVAGSNQNNPYVSAVQGAGGGTNPYTDQIAAAGGAANPYTSQIVSAGQQANDAGMGALQQMASGGPNPYLDSMFDQAAERVRDNTAAMFSKAGRYGSVAHQDQLSDSLGDMATNMYGQAYNQDQARRFSAAQALGQRQAGDISRNMAGLSQAAGLSAQDRSTGLGALSQAAGLANTDAARALQAQTAAGGLAQNANQQALQASTMFPALNNYAQSGNRGLMELGAMQEGKAAQHLQDSMDRFNFGQNAGWDLLSRYNQVVQPIAGMGGSSTQTGPKAQSGFGAALQGGLGTGLAAAAIPGVGPMAAIGLGGLGALGSLF